jgi:hypothetical protein
MVFECFMTLSRPPFTIWRVHWPHCKRRRHPSNVTHHRYCLVWYDMRIWNTCQCIGICLGLYLCLKALQSLELHKNINRQSALDIRNGDQSINLCIDGSFGCNMNKLFSAVETTIEIQCFSKCKINVSEFCCSGQIVQSGSERFRTFTERECIHKLTTGPKRFRTLKKNNN